MSRLRFNGTVAAAALVSCATLLVFLPALHNGFVSYDDPTYVVENPLIRSVGGDLWRGAFRFHALLWIPPVWISLALDRALFGPGPFGFHLTNVLLHSAAAGLATALAIRLLSLAAARGAEERRPAPGGVVLAGGVVAGLVWAIHPLRVESVAWITERKDVLSGVLALASASLYLGTAARAPAASRLGLRRLAPPFALGALAMASKSAAVTLPAAFLILDAWPLRRVRDLGLRAVFAEKLPLLAASALVSGLTAAAQRPIMMSLSQTSIPARLLIAAHSTFAYLADTAWPVGLSPYLPHPNEQALARPLYWLSAALLAAVTAAALRWRRRFPGLAAAWACWLVTLLPTLGLVQVAAQERADRFTYLPSLAPALLAGACVAAALARPGRRRLAVAAIAGGCVAALALGTRRQLPVWRDGVSFWTRAVERAPDLGVGYYHRARDLVRAGALPEAEADLTRSIEIAERKRFWHRAKIYFARGDVRAARGELGPALEDCDAAVALAPSPQRRYLLLRARLLLALGQGARAESDLARAALLAGPDEQDDF